ncbi:MFS transporter [Spongiactinospora sp. TRM90649]|uniref:CynX/NimT family MFS transporter n=1 Tax=Spongiactinospora sp. TRM90649 TaxID=3031114 RepID=UPI0023F8E012|nr:MFS transporter [Spongiactinospora sp. TRM90649]MDF5753277.1 MFS transporter [Spongiactinospora sp. TRM90649]
MDVDQAAPAANRRTAGTILLIAGLLLASVNMRPAIAGVSPLLGEIMADLGLTPAAGGAITTVMVVCLGVVAPLAPLLAGRIGLDRTLLAGLLVLTFGVLLRSMDGTVALYAGAALAGTAIAIMNVVMPGVVKLHFPDRVGLFTSLYTSGLVLGATAASGLMVPLEHATGAGWRVAVGSVAVPAIVATLVWLPQAVRRPHLSARQGHGGYRALLSRPKTWYVTVFMGLQSLTFYVMLAWLPTIFTDAGLPADQAGYLLSLTNLGQVIATLTVPAHAGRARGQVPHLVAACALTMAGYLGVLIAPTTVPWLWMVVLGLGQGASLALALLIIALRAPDAGSVTALSAVAQTFGYVLAALGPLLIGLLYQVSGGWTLPLTVGTAVVVVQLVAGVLAGRPSP